MINCIIVDRDKESRDAIEKLIGKISGVRFNRTCAALETAAKACLENNIQIVFINLYEFPVPKNEISMLKKIMKYGTQIILMSSRISIARETFNFNVIDFIILPTSSTRLWKAIVKGLQITNPEADTARIKKRISDGKRILLTS